MEEAVCELVLDGVPFDTVLRMDVESFRLLVRRMREVRARRSVDALWASFVAAQAGGKDVKKFAAALLGEADAEAAAEPASDPMALARALNNGVR